MRRVRRQEAAIRRQGPREDLWDRYLPSADNNRFTLLPTSLLIRDRSSHFFPASRHPKSPVTKTDQLELAASSAYSSTPSAKAKAKRNKKDKKDKNRRKNKKGTASG